MFDSYVLSNAVSEDGVEIEHDGNNNKIDNDLIASVEHSFFRLTALSTALTIYVLSIQKSC